MIDANAHPRSTSESEAAFDAQARLRQAALFAQITRWMVIMSALLAAGYGLAYLATTDGRIVPILLVCAGFSLVVAIIRRRVSRLVPAVYLVSALIAIGMMGVAASVSGLDALIAIATAILPVLFTGLLLDTRRMLPVSIVSLAAALATLLIDHAAGWARIDLFALPVIRWLVHATVGGTILFLLIALLRDLDRAGREARESARQLRLLYETSRLFGSAGTLDELLPIVADNLSHILDATGCLIILRDPISGEPMATAAYGTHQELYRRLRLQPDEPSVTRIVMQRRAPIVIEDVRNSPYVSPRAAAVSPSRSLMGLPLIHRDEVLGAVLIGESRRQRRFTQAEIVRVQGLAQQVAAEIASAQSLERERRQAADLAVLNRVSAAVSASLDPAEVSHLIVTTVSQAAGYQHVTLYLLEGRVLRLEAVTGHETTLREIPIERGIIGKTARTGRPTLLADVTTDPDYVAAIPDIVSEACAPIRFGDETLGVINVETHAPRVLDTGDLNLLVAIAAQIAVSLHNIQLFEQTRRHLEELKFLYELARATAAASDAAQVMHLAAGGLLRSLGVEVCAFSSWDRANNCVVTIGKYILDGDQAVVVPPRQLSYSLDEYPLTREVLEAQSIRQLRSDMPDAPPEEIALLRELGCASILLLPLVTHADSVGLIELYRKDAREFSADEITRGLAAANLVTSALERASLFDAERHSRQVTETLLEVARALGSTLERDKLLDLILDQLHRLVPYAEASIALASDDDSRRFVVCASHGLPEPLSRTPMVFDAESTATIRDMLSSRQPLRIGDTRDYPGWIQFDDAASARSFLGLPLQRDERIVGFLMLGHSQPAFFTDEHQRLAEAFTAHAAIAIENARLFEAEHLRRQEIEAVQRVSLSLTASLELSQVLDAILSATLNLVRAKDAHIFLYADGHLTFGAAMTPEGRMAQPLAEPRPDGLTDTVAHRGELIVVEDMRHYPFATDTPAEWEGSIVGLPLKIGAAVVGVMNVAYETPRQFPESELRVLSLLAAQAAIAIHNAWLFTEVSGRNRRMAAIQQAILETSRLGNLEATLDGLAHALVDKLGFDQSWIALADYEQDLLIGVAGAGVGVTQDMGHGGRPLTGLSSGKLPQSMARNSTIIKDFIEVPPTSQIERWLHHDLGVQSMADTPIPGADRPRGLISVAYTTARRVLPEDVEVLEAIARQAAIAIENARLLDQARQRAEREHLVRSVNSKISASIEIGTVMQTAVAELGRALGVSRCLIRLGADPDNMPVAHAFHQPGIPPLDAGARGRSGVPMLRQAVGERRTVVDLAPHFVGDARALSGLITPIFIRGQVAGVLALHQCDRPRRWTDEEIALIEDVSAQLGIAIDNARLYQEITHTLGDLGLLHNIAIAVASAASLPEAVSRVVESVHTTMRQAYGTLLLVDPDTSDLVVGASVGYDRDLSNVRIQAGQGITGWVARTGRPALAPDVRADPRFINTGGDPSIRSELAVPLIAGSQVVGVLNLESTQLDAFTEADMQLLTTLGGNLAMIIHNLRLLDEVRAANARLQELDRLKSQFLANMSHELRTPLNSILGFSEVLTDGLAGELSGDQREFITNIHASGQHLLELINDVLDLSKIHAGKLHLDCRSVAPHQVIDEASVLIAPLIAHKSQQLVLELDLDLPALSADAFRLKQVLINLLSNAHKFSPASSRITLAAHRGDGFVRFSVIDQGSGIKPEDHERIFQEFVQVDDGLTRKQEGTGLGLPITRRLVELHGGRIWIESAGIPGQGAAFHFTIPVVTLPDEPAPSVAAGDDRPQVLIVEDDHQFSHLLAIYLRQQGYQPIQHYSGQSVMPTVRELRPALITLDLMLPDRDGWSVLRDLKSAPDTRDIPVLIISALDNAGIDLNQGAVEYLTKPLDYDTLLAALRRMESAPRQAPQRVLIVDDDPLVGDLLAAMLPASEYAVTAVTNAPDALDAIRRDPPDAILLDLLMPGVNGHELLELLRADPATRDLPVIVVTALPLGEAERARLESKAQTVIKKGDLTREQLVDALRRLRLPARPELETLEAVQ